MRSYAIVRQAANSKLGWSLGATLLASAWAIWWPSDALQVIPAESIDRPAREPKDQQRSPPLLASALPKVAWTQVAVFDPFAGTPRVPIPEPKAVPPPPPPPPAPVVAAAPKLQYRFLGRVVDPAGHAIVFLGKQDQIVTATVGLRLDDGYVVETMDATAVQFLYPPLGVRASLPIPQSP